jgi:hypothetical protein
MSYQRSFYFNLLRVSSARAVKSSSDVLGGLFFIPGAVAGIILGFGELEGGAKAGQAIGRAVGAGVVGLLFSLPKAAISASTRTPLVLSDDLDSSHQRLCHDINNLSEDVLSNLVNAVVSRYKKEKSFFSSRSSQSVYRTLEDAANNIDSKKRVLIEYLREKEGGAYYNDGKRLFLIIVDEARAQLPPYSEHAESPPPYPGAQG